MEDPGLQEAQCKTSKVRVSLAHAGPKQQIPKKQTIVCFWTCGNAWEYTTGNAHCLGQSNPSVLPRLQSQTTTSTIAEMMLCVYGNGPFCWEQIIMAEEQRELQLRKHQKLIEMISNYSLSQEQEEHLRKIKEQTELEIAIRYLKSEQNKNYVFPLAQEQEIDDIQEFPGRVSFEQTFYDLCAQNFLPNKQRISKQATARRVKSLGPEKAHQAYRNNRVTERASEEDSSRQDRLRLPKIQSSKAGFKSLERLGSPLKEEKKSVRLKPLSKLKTEQKESLQYGMLLTKKLLTEEEETIKIGVTKILIGKRIHSPVKAFIRNQRAL